MATRSRKEERQDFPISGTEAIAGPTVSSSAMSTAWSEYLRGLSAPEGPIEPFQAARVRRLWEALRQRIGEELAPPYAAPLEDGRFALVWDRGDHHFEIELLPNGTYDWFYMDRSSSLRGGEEEQTLGSLSPEMIRLLHRTLHT